MSQVIGRTWEYSLVLTGKGRLNDMGVRLFFKTQYIGPLLNGEGGELESCQAYGTCVLKRNHFIRQKKLRNFWF